MMERRTTKSMGLLVLGLIALCIAIVHVNPFAKTYIASISSIRSLYTKTAQVTSGDYPFHQVASQYRKGCPRHQFKSVKYISRNPTMFIIEGFLTKLEAEVLVHAA